MDSKSRILHAGHRAAELPGGEPLAESGCKPVAPPRQSFIWFQAQLPGRTTGTLLKPLRPRPGRERSRERATLGSPDTLAWILMSHTGKGERRSTSQSWQDGPGASRTQGAEAWGQLLSPVTVMRPFCPALSFLVWGVQLTGSWYCGSLFFLLSP